MTPPLTRCFRGHATPSAKTFCESCGAALDKPARTGSEKDDGEVFAIANRRRYARQPGDVVPAPDARRRRFPRR